MKRVYLNIKQKCSSINSFMKKNVKKGDIIAILLILLTVDIFFIGPYTKSRVEVHYPIVRTINSIEKDYLHDSNLLNLYQKYVDKNGTIEDARENIDYIAIALLINELKKDDEYTFYYSKDQFKYVEKYFEEIAKKSDYKKWESADNTYYFKFASFNKKSLDKFKEYVEEMSTYKNVIIDLRNNHGGRVNVLKDLISHFLPPRSLYFTTVDRYGQKDNYLSNKTSMKLKFENIIIWVDEDSASCAEVFPLGLKENIDNITIIGKYNSKINKTTVGKGVTQKTRKFDDDGPEVHIVDQKWFSKNGVSVLNKGIELDIDLNKEYKDSTTPWEDATVDYLSNY